MQKNHHLKRSYRISSLPHKTFELLISNCALFKEPVLWCFRRWVGQTARQQKYWPPGDLGAWPLWQTYPALVPTRKTLLHLMAMLRSFHFSFESLLEQACSFTDGWKHSVKRYTSRELITESTVSTSKT